MGPVSKNMFDCICHITSDFFFSRLLSIGMVEMKIYSLVILGFGAISLF